MKPINIQNSIDDAISQEFDKLLKNISNDKLLKILVNLNMKGQSIEQINLDELIRQLS